MNRRGFLRSILAAGVAPYVVTTAGVLMPVRKLVTPDFGASILWRTRYQIEEIVKRDLAEAVRIDAEILSGYSAKLLRIETYIDRAAVVTLEYDRG
jgi:hypothetical protein